MNKLLRELQVELYWEKPEQFFKDITHLEPSKKETEFLKLTRNMDKKYIMVSAANQSGKTLTLSVIGLDACTTMSSRFSYPFKVLMLSGSWTQAHILQNYVLNGLKHPYVQSFLEGEPTKTRVRFNNGSWLTCLTASDFQVFGQTADLLIIDEAVLVKDKIIKDGYSRISGSKYKRYILSSTPEPEYYFSSFVNMWEKRNAGTDYLEWHPLNWTIYDCPWKLKDKRDLDIAKKNLTEEEWKSKWLGIPTFTVERGLFPIEHLRECFVKDGSIKFIPELPSIMGFDPGFFNPAVFEVFQVENDIWYMIHGESMEQKGTEAMINRIATVAQTFNVSDINVDSTRPELIIDLQSKVGCRVNSVRLKGEKASLQGTARNLVIEHRLRVEEKYKTMFKQMGVYTDKTSTNDDWVDAFLLSIRQVARPSGIWDFRIRKSRNKKSLRTMEFLERDTIEDWHRRVERSLFPHLYKKVKKKYPWE